MFEDFRKQADDAAFPEEPPEIVDFDSELGISQPQPEFLGMKAWQRLFIAIILMIMTCMLGSFCLLLTGKVFPPIFG